MLTIQMSVGCVREGSENGALIVSPDAVYEVLKEYAQAKQEMFFVLTISTRKRLIDTHMVGMGILDSNFVHAREVFFPAIQDSASSIIVAHNHPSGDTTPSAEDVRITRRLVEAGGILEIPINDHIIIGRKKDGEERGFLSLRESGLCSFKD
jgi:DNA repair protein RadC